MLNTPIAYICFNRSEIVKSTFLKIIKQKPKKLYLIMDGPRKNNITDLEQISKIQSFIKVSIKWDCDLVQLYSNKNLGLKNRIITGLNHVFKNEKKAIILEDDCLPHDDFFYFCENLLEKYSKSKNVKFITGNNFQKENNINDDYYFSKYSHIWGWACYSDLWNEIIFDQDYWNNYLNSEDFDNLFELKSEKNYWLKTFELICEGKQNSWSIYLLFTMWKKNYLSVTPKINLVENLGLVGGTNTKSLLISSKLSLLNLNKPLIHPSSTKRNIKNDQYVFKNIYKKNLFQKILERLKKINI